MVFRFDYWCFGDIVLSTVTFLFLYMWGVFFFGMPWTGIGTGIWGGKRSALRSGYIVFM